MRPILYTIFVFFMLSVAAYADGADDNFLNMGMIDNPASHQNGRAMTMVFGRISSLNDVRCDLWEGGPCTYTFPTQGQRMYVISSSAADAANGRGVRSVMIHYLDSNYIEHSETVTTNGTGSTPTVSSDIMRVNGFHSYSTGTTAAAAGTITLMSSGATVTYAAIIAGFNTARQAIYTVPAYKNFYMAHWQSTAGTSAGQHLVQVSIRATAHLGVYLPGVFLVVDDTGLVNGEQTSNLPVPIRIPAKSDVKLSAVSDANNAGAFVTGTFQGFTELMNPY